MELTPADVHDSSKEIDLEKVASYRGESDTPRPFPVQTSGYKLMGTESDMNALI